MEHLFTLLVHGCLNTIELGMCHTVLLQLVSPQFGFISTGKRTLIACERFYAEMDPLNVSHDGLFLLCGEAADVRALGIALEECYHLMLKSEDFCPVVLIHVWYDIFCIIAHLGGPSILIVVII